MRAPLYRGKEAVEKSSVHNGRTNPRVVWGGQPLSGRMTLLWSGETLYVNANVYEDFSSN